MTKAKTQRKKHKTTKEGTGEQGRQKVQTEQPADDPAKPGTIEYKTLNNDPKYGAEFTFSWTVGGCFNAACTQKHVTITTAGWQKTYITSVSVRGVPKLGSMQLHRRVAPQFKAFFLAAVKKGLAGKVTSYDGGFVARTITKNEGKLSNHALGTAIDINAAQNGYGTKGAARGADGSVRELADFSADFGLYWGGWYSRSKDLMHFEAVKVIEGAELRAACEKHGVVYEEVVPMVGGWPDDPGPTSMA